jgi:sec-independent protein translocase protein TatC
VADQETDTQDKIPFTAHLEELRKRLITCFVAVGIGFALSYGFKEKLFQILTQPLISVMKQGETLIYTGLPEAFFTFLKVSFLAGLMVASPVIIYQFWMFVAPGLYDREKRLMIPIVLLSSIFFVGGALFGYFIVFPFGFQFFLGFATETIRPMPSMKEYLSFSAKLLLAFGLVFELPLVLTFLARLGIVSVSFLKKNRKYALLLFFVGAAILTPPDVVTQIMMALPLMLLYEISIVGARIFGKKKTVNQLLKPERRPAINEPVPKEAGSAIGFFITDFENKWVTVDSNSH